MMDWLYTPAPSPYVAAALLVLRCVVGTAFILHGRPKLQHPVNWMNAFGMPQPAAAALQLLAVIAEVGGGLAVLLGFLTRLAAIGLIAQMIGALALVHVPHKDPFVGHGRSSAELPILYVAIALLLLAVGPGPWSLDALLFR